MLFSVELCSKLHRTITANVKIRCNHRPCSEALRSFATWAFCLIISVVKEPKDYQKYICTVRVL